MSNVVCSEYGYELFLIRCGQLRSLYQKTNQLCHQAYYLVQLPSFSWQDFLEMSSVLIYILTEASYFMKSGGLSHTGLAHSRQSLLHCSNKQPPCPNVLTQPKQLFSHLLIPSSLIRLSSRKTSRDWAVFDSTVLQLNFLKYMVSSFTTSGEGRQLKTCNALATEMTHGTSIYISLARISHKAPLNNRRMENGGSKQNGE